jgi:hypothetical protein
MMEIQPSKKSIEEAAQVIGKTWLLYSFVTKSLTGYERMPFEQVVLQAKPT